MQHILTSVYTFWHVLVWWEQVELVPEAPESAVSPHLGVLV
jgi:hypothetical protein